MACKSVKPVRDLLSVCKPVCKKLADLVEEEDEKEANCCRGAGQATKAT